MSLFSPVVATTLTVENLVIQKNVVFYLNLKRETEFKYPLFVIETYLKPLIRS